MVLRSELTAILRACRDQGLDCVPLRGLALAEKLYGANALRPTGDIDLLVRRQNLPVITDLLTGLGYAGMEHRPGFAGSFSYTLEFVKDRHGWIVVEPHWTLAYPPFTDALDMEKVWSRCRRGSVTGVDAWLLSDEDLLVHLCFHILHHGNSTPLLWWKELDLLIRQTGTSLDWDTITENAEQSGQSFLVSEVLQRLRGQFHTPIPQPALTGLAAGGSRTRLTNLLAHAPTVNGREEFAQFMSLPGFRERFRYALGLLFPSPAYMVRRYGLTRRTQLGLSYVTRLTSVCWDGLKWMSALFGATASTKTSSLR
jgi:hypothetical protein